MTDLMIPTMTKTFGKQPIKMPRGFFKAVHFPVLARLDQLTDDQRMLVSSGADVRTLPLSIKYASKTGFGHEGAEVSGALFEVTVDPANNNMSGSGFLLDDEHGRRHARLIATMAMNGNSVDLTGVRGRYVEDFQTGEEWIEFYQFKLGATTGVSTPAFPDAHAVVDELDDDEIVAALVGPDPMVPLIVQTPEEFTVNIIGAPEGEEMTAAYGAAPFDAFYMPEADRPTKIVVDGNGNVYGHLALWESCHDAIADRCLRVPRPNDGYASFNKAGVLTERGQVDTGPIFAFGGHRSAKSAATIEEAYGGIENSWCDVRVIEGKLGPWLSGRIRPGVPEETIYAVRASRISGHWVNGRLKAIVSVNAEGFDVPGFGAERELVAGFGFATNDHEVCELVASFPDCAATEQEYVPQPAQTYGRQLVFHFANDAELNQFTTGIITATTTTETFTTMTADEVIEAVEAVDENREWADQMLADILADDRDAADRP